MSAMQRVGLVALALALIVTMVFLGLWQLGVYDNKQRSDALSREHDAPVALDSVLGRDEAFPGGDSGRPVTATGRYAVARQLWVARGVAHPGRYAVTTPLVTSSGSAILVVRGEVGHIGDGAAAPSGLVSIAGILEPPTGAGTAPTRDGRIDGLETSALVNAFPMDLYDGYVVLTDSVPPSRLVRVTPPLPSASQWAGLRNLLYAFQWWLFAAFVVFMTWRMIADRTATVPAEPTSDRSTV
jgi:cytochrome oxidase assembly protein ShyY1